MTDDTMNAAEIEPEIPAGEIEQEADLTENLQEIKSERVDEPEAEETEGEEPEEEAEPEPQFAEIEFNGKKYQVHPDLRDGFLMNADYTRKTQATAEKARELEAREQEIERRYQVSEEDLRARAALMNVSQQLQQFQQTDWETLEREDPFAAQAQWRKYQQLRDSHGQITMYLQHRQQEMDAERQRETAKHEAETNKRLWETRQYAEKNIKGWTPEVDAKVTEFATKELGFDLDTLKNAYTPNVYRAIHLAWIGHQSMQKQLAKPKPAQPPAATISPLKTVGAKSSPSARKTLAEMSMEEYAEARRAGRG